MTFNDEDEQNESPFPEQKLKVGKQFTTDSFKTDDEHISEVDEEAEKEETKSQDLGVSNSITNLEIDNVLNRVSPQKTDENQDKEGEDAEEEDQGDDDQGDDD